MTDKEKIRNIIELFIAWNGETDVIDVANIDSAVEFIANSLQEDSVSNPIDFEKELYKAFGQVKDFTLCMQIAKWFYDMGKNSQEPVGEGLEKASDIYGDELDNVLAVCNDNDDDNTIGEYAKEAFKAGAKWQKEQTIEKACNWLDENLLNYWGQINANDTDEFIKKFRKAMKL